jgi:RNA polymerase sigma factor (TIGR02999 family)
MTSNPTSEAFAQLYQELRRRARGELFRHQLITMGPNTLLHEAWMQMQGRALEFATQAELVAYAARTMRGIVIDHVRARSAQRRGGNLERLPYETSAELSSKPDAEMLALADALDDLAREDASLAELVELKFFAGLTVPEVAGLRGHSERTVERDWERARHLLFRALKE